jgi:hypothetical protein
VTAREIGLDHLLCILGEADAAINRPSEGVETVCA